MGADEYRNFVTDRFGAAIAFDPTQPVMNGNSKYGGYYAWENAGEFISIATKNPVAHSRSFKPRVIGAFNGVTTSTSGSARK